MTLVNSLENNFEQPNTRVAEPFPLCLERPLGAVVSQSGTQFAIWAPTAEKITLRLFSRGSKGEDGDALIGQFLMRPEADGSWTYDFADNKHGLYYDFLIERDCGSVDRVADPWAHAAGVNGRRSMVVDLPRTDPEGWDADRMPEVPIAQTVVWETHVGDFSNDPAGGFPESHRGKYLAFTDLGTTLDGHPDFPTGLSYLKKLGITAVQLMPIYDFGSVDETICSRYNWGYDPVNYNVPEGSYSTNPYDGSVRIREVKQMVQALHNAGIKVIMDVVYNHMFSPDNWFERIVPEYFLRRKPNGALSNGSGCGCDMATERAMFRRFVVESVAYWAREYHLDGFRFDLMGLIDVDAVNAWRASKQPEGVAGQVIQYVSAHDDLTLWDKLCASLAAKSLGSAVSEGDNENSVDVPKALYDADLSEAGLASAGSAIAGAMATVMDANRMAAGIVLTSAGIPFMLSGEEFARTKYGNSDSYDSARELNWLDWTRAWRMRDLVEYYTKLIALRKSSAEWFDGDRVIVSVEGDELVFRVGDYLVAVNPGRHIGAIDVASTAVAPVSESSRVWCGMGSSTNASAACISAGDGDYLIVPPHTFAIWRLR